MAPPSARPERDDADLRRSGVLWAIALMMLLATAGAGILIGTRDSTPGAWLVQAHLHAGSIGWMTVALMALALPMLRFSQSSTWTTPALAFAGAIALFLLGSAAAIVAALRSSLDLGPGTTYWEATHGAVLTTPYVVLATGAAVEWALRDDESKRPATAMGMVQVGLAVLSGAALFFGVLRSHLALIAANVPLLLASVAIFLARIAPRVFEGGWWHDARRRWLALSVGFLAVDVGLFAHVLFEVGRLRYSSIELVPEWLLFAIDHVTFVAVMTSALLGAVLSLVREGTPTGPQHRIAAVAMPVGLFGAVAGIASELETLSRIAMSVFGGAVILATLATIRVVRRSSWPASPVQRSRRREEDLARAHEVT